MAILSLCVNETHTYHGLFSVYPETCRFCVAVYTGREVVAPPRGKLVPPSGELYL